MAHYSEQNGDQMADPEMTFGEADGKFYPLSFRNDYLGFEQEVVRFREGREPQVNEARQRDLVEFTAQWLRNVVVQQELSEEEERKE